MISPPEVINPYQWDRQAWLPPLGLIPGGSFALADLIALKTLEKLPVHLVFPVASPREGKNLARLLEKLRPLLGRLIDRVWVAFGGKKLGQLPQALAAFPEVSIFPARQALPPDQKFTPLGKGAVMRAWLYHLVINEKVTHPRAVIQFLDADIRPAYFQPHWVVDAVGALFRFSVVEAVKIVYQRPRGGRLNTMLRSLLALCPHAGVQTLLKLAYLLSGEIAGTLHFWTSLPFKSGYGVETLTLLAFALDRLKLAPDSADLEHLVQVYVGQMDHRHAPLTSTRRKRGLDQMAGNVFHTLEETLRKAGIFSWQGTPVEKPVLSLPIQEDPGGKTPGWLEVPITDVTLPPLRTCVEIRAALGKAGL
ncbi:MAG: hypothetical protein AB1491_04660 [Thermodesulfobacteriota bacterium]